MKEVHVDTSNYMIDFENSAHGIRSMLDDSLDELTKHRNKLVELDKIMDDIWKYQRSSEEKYIESLNGFDKSLEKTNDSVGRTLLMYGRLKGDVDELAYETHESDKMAFDVFTSLLIGMSKIERKIYKIIWAFVLLLILFTGGVLWNIYSEGIIEYGLIGCVIICIVLCLSMMSIDKLIGDIVEVCRHRIKIMIKDRGNNNDRKAGDKESD